MALVEYHLAFDDDYAEEIRQGLERKLDALVRHELYAKYKTAPTAEEREQARQAYLDQRGVFPDFRW
ncbi:complexin-2 [Oscillospiraceae bacterium 42-9]